MADEIIIAANLLLSFVTFLQSFYDELPFVTGKLSSVSKGLIIVQKACIYFSDWNVRFIFSVFFSVTGLESAVGLPSENEPGW
jgi:hypothetical protein